MVCAQVPEVYISSYMYAPSPHLNLLVFTGLAFNFIPPGLLAASVLVAVLNFSEPSYHPLTLYTVMRFSTSASLALFAAVVTGTSYTLTVSAIPYSRGAVRFQYNPTFSGNHKLLPRIDLNTASKGDVDEFVNNRPNGVEDSPETQQYIDEAYKRLKEEAKQARVPQPGERGPSEPESSQEPPAAADKERESPK
ncbi:hypothetical protein BC835DRAFT_1423512 [Cytidiella melzeri]|nr:hypothetical protein BC835DRAFT_1423512 [Cytidiella melzeri]